MLALSLPQWLHLSRTNIRALAMNPKALCILAPSLMSAPVLASLTLSLPLHTQQAPTSETVLTHPCCWSPRQPDISMAPGYIALGLPSIA